jgi:hypothetical protein
MFKTVHLFNNFVIDKDFVVNAFPFEWGLSLGKLLF